MQLERMDYMTAHVGLGDKVVLDLISSERFHCLRLDDVLDVVLESLCNDLGFSFATISLTNEDQQEIQTVRGKNVSEDWIADARHRLDSHDIQADVLRTGKVEVTSGWDPRFDEQIWKEYNHAELVRVWVPLGNIGTIEAGFYKRERNEISVELVEILKDFAHSITVAIRNAQLYEREQQFTAALARLHELGLKLHTDPWRYNEAESLEKVRQTAHAVLGVSTAMIYLRQHDSLVQRTTQPTPSFYLSNHEERKESKIFANYDIVYHIAQTCEPYYQSDVQNDPLVTISDRDILSFAGVPLMVRGKLLGVLCLFYCERNQFSTYTRQLIELVAHQAEAVIASNQLVRAQEQRRQLEYDLHDSVKSSIRGLILLSDVAAKTLETDPHATSKYLRGIQHATWDILADVNTILHGLSQNGYGSQTLQTLIREDLHRRAAEDWSKIRFEMDEDLPLFPTKLIQTLLCSVREAVINALQHGKAQAISVDIHCSDGQLRLEVKDNGCGFVTDTERGDEHRGLAIMQERIKEIGGYLRIVSTKGTGTTISISLLLEEKTYGTYYD